MTGRAYGFASVPRLRRWDDAKNPQFLVFLNGEAVQGADMNHRRSCF